MSGLERTVTSSPVVVHTLRSTTQSEGRRIHTQESTTTEKVSDVAECVICYEPRTSDQRPTLIHKINQNCDAHKNRQICQICLPQLDSCPLCRENLATGEMQNSLVEMRQNNPHAHTEESEESENENPPLTHAVNININVQNQDRPGFPYELVCMLTALVAVCVGGYLVAWALDTHK